MIPWKVIHWHRRGINHISHFLIIATKVNWFTWIIKIFLCTIYIYFTHTSYSYVRRRRTTTVKYTNKPNKTLHRPTCECVNVKDKIHDSLHFYAVYAFKLIIVSITELPCVSIHLITCLTHTTTNLPKTHLEWTITLNTRLHSPFFKISFWSQQDITILLCLMWLIFKITFVCVNTCVEQCNAINLLGLHMRFVTTTFDRQTKNIIIGLNITSPKIINIASFKKKCIIFWSYTQSQRPIYLGFKLFIHSLTTISVVVLFCKRTKKKQFTDWKLWAKVWLLLNHYWIEVTILVWWRNVKSQVWNATQYMW